VPKHWPLGGWYTLGLIVHQQRYRPSDSNKNIYRYLINKQLLTSWAPWSLWFVCLIFTTGGWINHWGINIPPLINLPLFSNALEGLTMWYIMIIMILNQHTIDHEIYTCNYINCFNWLIMVVIILNQHNIDHEIYTSN
jgi:hypothetical protein